MGEEDKKEQPEEEEPDVKLLKKISSMNPHFADLSSINSKDERTEFQRQNSNIMRQTLVRSFKLRVEETREKIIKQVEEEKLQRKSSIRPA